MADHEVAPSPRYRFGVLEQRGMLLGWRGGQIIVVLASLVGAVALLRLSGGAPAAGGAAAVVLVGLALAWWPVGGRTAEQWAPAVARWLALSAAQRARGTQMLRVPELLEATPGGACVLHDRPARTLSLVMALPAGDFPLADPGVKAQRVARWSAALASLARGGSPIRRVQWLSVSSPTEADDLWSDFGRRCVLEASAPARRSYAELLTTAIPLATDHDVFVVLQLRLEKAVLRRARAFGSGVSGGAALLLREAEQLAGSLHDADLPLPRPLSREQVAVHVGDGWPARQRRSRARTGWSWFRAGDTWHATFWVAEWPRVDVGSEFLAPLLLEQGRSVFSVVMQPIDPVRAMKLAQRARVADVADGELRRRGGFLTSARRGRETDMAVRREAELADGYAAYRFSGYLTVSAASRPELETACEAATQAGARAGIDLRRLRGEQDRGFLATRPLGVGVR